MDSLQIQVERTIQYWPSSSQLRQNLSIPLAFSFCPTAEQKNIASFNQKNLQKFRCQSCKAFINKFCLIRNQNEYDCSLCGYSNYLDQKISKNSPQMISNSYKCKASKMQFQLSYQFSQRTIVNRQRVFVFILDLSNYDEISQKYLIFSINAIKQFLKRAFQEKINLKVMFLAFDMTIQLFSIKNQLQRIVYWQDEKNTTIKQIPFNNDQIANIKQCKDNVFALLDGLQEEANERKLKNQGNSKKIMEIIQYSLKYTRVDSGKIFIVSGLTHQLQKIKIMRTYDSTIQDALKNNYQTVKKQCLNEELISLINCTQMSISLFFHKSFYSNLMPFYILTKVTNGQLRNYLKNQAQYFFYEFNYLLHQCLYQLKYQTLLRVRTGSGIKLVGIFGNYRPWKGIPQQIQMLSCSTNRKYTFQFIIQGIIKTPTTVVQFSVLQTDLLGNRYYKIITLDIPLTNQINILLASINYDYVNETYLKAIVHNMDLTPYHKKLQLALKQRCRKHIKFIRQHQLFTSQKNRIQNNSQIFEPESMKNVKNYAIFTFMLMNHILMNPPQHRNIYLDLNIETRSKINTYEQSVKIIWPIIYIINPQGYQIIQMKAQNYQKAKIGIIIDRCDQIYLYIKDIKIRNQLKRSNNIISSIKQIYQLQNIYKLLQEIEQRKLYPYLDILLLQQNFKLGFDLFSWKGNHSFQNFIQDIIDG